MTDSPKAKLQALLQQARQLHQQNRLPEAIELYNAVLSVAPNSSVAHMSLGVALRATGRAAAAVVCHSRAIALEPENSVMHSNLGNALKDVGRFEEAVASHDRSLEINPKSAETWYNRGVALKAGGKLQEALESFEKAIALKPEHVDAQWDRSLILLHLGDTKQGWEAYESRWLLPNHRGRDYPQPRWKGEPLAGKTLLLYPEQGFGDTIQMLRFLPSVAAAGGRVITQIQPELLRLARSSFPGHEFVARGEALPQFDLHCPLMSLPFVFQLRLEQLPGHIPYLQPPDEAVKKFKAAINRVGPGVKVGFLWSGSVTFAANHLRAVAFERFLPLMEVPGTHFFCLQMGPTREQLKTSGAAGLVTDLAAHIDDFADTAGAIAQLDLVIMTDSSVAHLTGALGQPVWDLLPLVADWRWLAERTDSPWYPSMRLFRQSHWNRWDDVFEQVKRNLMALSAAERSGGGS